MIKRRVAITPLGCFLLGLALAAVMFAVATTDLALPSLSHPKVGEQAPISYRVPTVHVVQELDEKSLYWRVRFEVPAGSTITHSNLKKLRALEEHRRPPGLGFALGLAALLITLFVVASYCVRLFVRNGHLLRVQLVLFLPLVLLLALAKLLFVLTPLSVFWIPLAALSMTWAIVHTRIAGIAVGATGAVAASTLFPLDLGLLIALSAQALVPALLMDRVRKRRSPGIAWLGGCAAAVLAYVGYHWLAQGSLPPEDLHDLQRSGLLAVIGAAAMSPLLTYVLKPVFQPLLGLVSPGRLMQLSDLDHPLLAELAEEAPGTWQHTLAMANLAEVVCTTIGANSKLARVGAYYHDVGKLTNPKYFAENLESGDTSPHLELPPEESAGFIFEHVTEGARLAKQHKLPYAVREFIFTHHGDGLLEFFWHKCQEQGNPRDLPEDAFHYPGIRPQTKETAILVVVDAVEAASRTLRDPDADRIDSLVRRIVSGKLKSGQLDEAGLTGADLGAIVTTLQEVLRSQHHVRPEYPWQKREAQARAETGVPEETKLPSEELSAALERDLSGPVPIPRELQTAPEKTAPEKTAPEKTAPEKTAPEKTAPEKTAPEPRPAKDMPDDTIREPSPTSGDSDA
jgi:putative nucleotidyltransferase with HDIG domain